MEPTTQIAAYNTKLEADMAMARLGNDDIEAMVSADNLGGTFPMMQMITGGFKVRVRTEDESRARETLGIEFPPIESDPPARVSYFQEVARAAVSTKTGRIRGLVYVILVLLAAFAVLLSTTQGTL